MATADSTALVIFGGAGDLSLRKLMPSLYALHVDKQLPPNCKIIAIARSNQTQAEFHAVLRGALEKHRTTPLETATWDAFAERVRYLAMDALNGSAYGALKEALSASGGQRIFYLATRSDLYAAIAQHLREQEIADADSRIVLEKPIGMDLHSAQHIDSEVGRHFRESQIYRIDHYLGKETVQNLLVLRFGNTIFESQWNQKYIDHIQITISETLGVEDRAEFYEKVGALRDMLQNHLLQLLCITTMEPPSRMNPDAVRDEKVKILRALKPLTPELIRERVVRGQYGSGVSGERRVPGYRQEAGVDPDSSTETFVALRVDIDNWRWAGVPFYLRTGKRLAERACEILVQFKEVPHSIFGEGPGVPMANRLLFRLQPDEGVKLQLFEKRSGAGMQVRSTELSLSPDRLRKQRIPEAYERLLGDVIAGNQTLFVRRDELLAAWEWLNPIIAYWQASESRPEPYTAGSWGPAAATLLLARDGRLWDDHHAAK